MEEIEYFDFSIIDEMDESKRAELLEIYVRTTTENLVLLKEFHTSKNISQVYQVSHKMIGSSGIVGAILVRKLAVKISAISGENNELPEVSLLNEIETEFVRYKRVVETKY